MVPEFGFGSGSSVSYAKDAQMACLIAQWNSFISSSLMSYELFRTPVDPSRKPLISQEKSLISLGSCFADGIGLRLKDAGFAILANPFGTLFHPFPLFDMLDPDMTLGSSGYLDIQGKAHHYRLPKTFYAQSKDELEGEFKKRHSALHQSLAHNSVLFLTLGTSHLYTKDGVWVANCHQQPAALFQKEMSSLEAMTEVWEKLFPKLPATLQIIVTVSPVRHLKDGLVENSLAKSLLRVLAHTMVSRAPERFHYFPAYEILLDELRDYRYYASDMLHPSEVALDYIWKRFQESLLTDSARDQIKRWDKLKGRLNHRPIHPDSAETARFHERLQRDLKAFYEAPQPQP
ncbi:MAG: GSCFA family protein [Proteobacteria bacterium]|nr:MAG: GSCFA family protein [Pseudomonadota bacterium]